MKKVLAFLLAIFCPLSVMALESIDILSDEDAAVYQQIFLLQDKEKIDSAKKLENKLMDKSLMHEVLYQRFVSKTYHTRGVEIQNWMNKNYDMPGAERLAKIANLKKVSVKKPVSPHILTGKEYIETAQSETWTAKNYSGKAAKKIEKFKKSVRSGSSKNARLILEDKSFKSKITSADYGRLAGRLSYLYYKNGEYELAKNGVLFLLMKNLNMVCGQWDWFISGKKNTKKAKNILHKY